MAEAQVQVTRRTRSIRATIVVAALAMVAVLSGCQPTDLRTLASDQMQGRANLSPGSALARAYIVDRLEAHAEGANASATGDAAYVQPFARGTNIVAVIPGTDLADQYVMIGAHYDHLASENCSTAIASDTICNGATDNAAGVSAVLNVVDELGAKPPRRSVIVALWDAEEEGRGGSKFYAANPLIPLADTVAYVNIDMQGADLLPSLRNTTFAVASETGGAQLQGLVTDAAHRSPLDVAILSNVFGAGYSDQSSFIPKSIPSVFFTDSAAGCYHTAQDSVAVVDWGKLERQRKMLLDVVGHLTNDDAKPAFVSGTPLATFEDVRQFKRIVDTSSVDIKIHSVADQQLVASIRTRVNEVFAAGPSKFDSAAANKFLLAALDSNHVLERDPCNGGYQHAH